MRVSITSLQTSLTCVRDGYDGAYEGRADSFADALSLALGKPPYGFAWYQIKSKTRSYDPTR
jgi:hypothetical protein